MAVPVGSQRGDEDLYILQLISWLLLVILAFLSVQKQQRAGLLQRFLMRAEKGGPLLAARAGRGLYSLESLLKAQCRRKPDGTPLE